MQGKPVTQVVVYPYLPDNARGTRYGFAVGHEHNDFVRGGYRTLDKAVKAAERFARQHGVKVESIREY